jgi:hypothetical protein
MCKEKNPDSDEITDEMRYAGELAVLEYDHDYESAQDAAVRIYLAMKDAKPSDPFREPVT